MPSDPTRAGRGTARERRGGLRLRELLVARDAELGAARGRVLELETRAQVRARGGPQAARAAGERPQGSSEGSADRGADGGGAALLDSHAGLRNAGRRPAGDAAIGPAPALPRLGAVPRRRCLERAARRRRCSRPPQRRDPRIRVRRRGANGGIVAASNDALAMARGEFIVLLDHDDKLHPDALTFVAEALDDEPEADYLYTDEDKIDRVGLHSGPFCKPDWSPERMRTQMYTCHLSVLRRALVEEVGGFDPEFEGSQDWDLVLKVTERARQSSTSPGSSITGARSRPRPRATAKSAKPWAFEAGQRAVQAHCERIGLEARVERDEALPGVYHLQPGSHPPADGQHRHPDERPAARGPLPGGRARRALRSQHRRDVHLRRTTRSSAWPTPRPTLADRRAGGDRRRSAAASSPYDGEFNFSAKINLGAEHSEGELLLLLNDDMEVVTPDWIERMAMYAQHPGIGAVGGAPALGGRPPPARRRPLRERRAPGSHLPRLHRALQGLREQHPRRPELPRGHRRLHDDAAARLRARWAGCRRTCRSTTTTWTTASSSAPGACGSSTTPTPSSTTSSRPAARRRSRTGRRRRWSSAGCPSPPSIPRPIPTSSTACRGSARTSPGPPPLPPAFAVTNHRTGPRRAQA